jgi:hypothetical protein
VFVPYPVFVDVIHPDVREVFKRAYGHLRPR